MPTFTLDGQEIPFEKGDSIIKAAWRQGVEIPHYCWHPGLSVAANCRMCLVEIKSDRPMMLPVLRWDDQAQQYTPVDKPKLVPSCQTGAAEGMQVLARSGNALKAQAAVQEFLLLNHPVDCPICDQAGECKLQDYWLTSQGSLKRKRGEPVHKPKGVRFGPTIVYDAERCIVCTRCIRVCDELVHDHVLDMRERGNRNEIILSPGRELDHRYTLMTEHVCPVGALTSRDFRFKARVWFLRAAPSVCPGCATGCNSFIDYDPRDNRAHRLRPRDNSEVNGFWMCDDGMLTYQRIHEDRVRAARVWDAKHAGNGDGRANGRDSHAEGVDDAGGFRRGQGRILSVAQALSVAAEALGRIEAGTHAVVLSAQYCNEDNFALAQLATGVLGASRMYLAALGGWEGDDILRDSDNNPNRAGAQQVAGKRLGTLADLAKDVESGLVRAVVGLGAESDEPQEQLTALAKLEVLVLLASHAGPLLAPASLVLPVACYAEMDGTFVNRDGKAQRFRRALPPAVGVQPAWAAIAALAKAMSKPFAYDRLPDLRRAMGASAPAEPRAAEGRV
ncbi:MAG: 2Fe-2S iron-sulfur cluster-binding protein [Proteobacteria bacterium]|nr:2Fe-2S iron-sulfur cluster-binding protein [Pseudomonadota bacterium]